MERNAKSEERKESHNSIKAGAWKTPQAFQFPFSHIEASFPSVCGPPGQRPQNNIHVRRNYSIHCLLAVWCGAAARVSSPAEGLVRFPCVWCVILLIHDDSSLGVVAAVSARTLITWWDGYFDVRTDGLQERNTKAVDLYTCLAQLIHCTGTISARHSSSFVRVKVHLRDFPSHCGWWNLAAKLNKCSVHLGDVRLETPQKLGSRPSAKTQKEQQQ